MFCEKRLINFFECLFFLNHIYFLFQIVQKIDQSIHNFNILALKSLLSICILLPLVLIHHKQHQTCLLMPNLQHKCQIIHLDHFQL